MSPGHVIAIVQAECVKLFSRSSARLGLLLAFLVGLGMPVVLWLMNSDTAVVNGAPLSQSLEASAPRAALWALYLRNLWVMQAVVLLLCAQSLAGELQARTLREDLLRPVSRGAVLLAKYLSVALFVALSLSLQYLVSTGAGLVFFGTDGPWREVFLGYLATGVADLSFAAVAFAITALFRSVAGTVLITMLFIVFEKIAAWALFVVSSFVQALPPEMNNLPQAVYLLFDLQPGLPSAAWNVGTTLASGGEVALITWAAAAFYLAAGGLVALLRTLWMEIP